MWHPQHSSALFVSVSDQKTDSILEQDGEEYDGDLSPGPSTVKETQWATRENSPEEQAPLLPSSDA